MPKKKASNAAPKAHKKRPRAILSDDEAESDALPPRPASESAQPAQAPRKKERKDVDKTKDRDGERKRDKPKKPRTKDRDTGADAEIENTPVRASASGSASTSAEKTKRPVPAAAAAPRSATNIARPPEAVVVSDVHHADLKPQLEQPSESEKAKAKAKTARKSKPRPQPTHHDSEDRSTTPAPVSDTTSADAPHIVPKPSPRHREEHTVPAYTYDLPLPPAELEGMLIETLATARASSLATSALFGALMAARPALREMALPTLKDDVAREREREREEKEREKEKEGGRGARAKADAAAKRAWVPALEELLETGAMRCGVFGKVVNSGTVRLFSLSLIPNHPLSTLSIASPKYRPLPPLPMPPCLVTNYTRHEILTKAPLNRTSRTMPLRSRRAGSTTPTGTRTATAQRSCGL